PYYEIANCPLLPRQPGLEPVAQMRRQRHRLVRLGVEQHHDAFGSGGAALAHEDALADAEGAAADGEDACADIDRPRIIELGAEIELEAHDGEFSIAAQVELLIIEEADAAALAEGGKDGIVDVALPIGIAVAQRVRRPDGVSRAQRR